MEQVDVGRWLQDGVAAARAGDKAQARALLARVVERDERNETAWLWLSGVVDDPEERRICLENVLTINPGNAAAQAGLRWLEAHAAPAPAAAAADSSSSGGAETAATARPAPPVRPAPEAAAPTAARPPAPAGVDIDPYGCPYCGGPVGGEARCPQCDGLLELRERRRPGGEWPGWPLIVFFLQAGVVAGEAFLVGQMAALASAARLLVPYAPWLVAGRAALAAGGPEAGLARLTGALAALDVAMAGLALVLLVGLVLRVRLAYFAALLLIALMTVTAIAGVAAGLTGVLVAAFRLVLAVLAFKWLADSAPAYEWLTRRYNADVDGDLQTAMDYYDKGAQYWQMGMWAKAAAHWRVATQLEGGRADLRAALARAYLKLGYSAAAREQAEKAAARAPDDEELRAFRDALAGMGQEP